MDDQTPQEEAPAPAGPVWAGNEKISEYRGSGWKGNDQIVKSGPGQNVTHDPKTGKALTFNGKTIERDPYTGEITKIGDEKVAGGSVNNFFDLS